MTGELPEVLATEDPPLLIGETNARKKRFNRERVPRSVWGTSCSPLYQYLGLPPPCVLQHALAGVLAPEFQRARRVGGNAATVGKSHKGRHLRDLRIGPRFNLARSLSRGIHLLRYWLRSDRPSEVDLPRKCSWEDPQFFTVLEAVLSEISETGVRLTQ
jgi:hypothetical protein